MDYGHTGQINGAGTNSVDTNNFEAKNNLDLTNKDISWTGPSADRDLRSIGGSVINSRETSHHQEEDPSSPELGKIIDLAMPPGVKQDNPYETAKKADIIEASLNHNVIKTKDRLDPAGVKEVDNAIAKLNQTGDVADFYDTARNAMETNLDNSYNRKLAAWKFTPVSVKITTIIYKEGSLDNGALGGSTNYRGDIRHYRWHFWWRLHF